MQDTNLRCIGHQRADELELGFHRQRVARAGDVAGVLAVGAGEHGADRVGHGSVDDRDARILRGVEGSHRRWGRNRANHVVLSSHHVGNLGRNGGVRLRVLNVKHNVFAFDEAFFGQTFDETDAAVVQRTVFGELDDADVNHLVRKGGRAQQEEQGSQQGSQLLHHNGVPSFPKSSFFIGTKNAPVVSD